MVTLTQHMYRCVHMHVWISAHVRVQVFIYLRACEHVRARVIVCCMRMRVVE